MTGSLTIDETIEAITVLLKQLQHGQHLSNSDIAKARKATTTINAILENI